MKQFNTCHHQQFLDFIPIAQYHNYTMIWLIWGSNSGWFKIFMSGA